MNLLEQIKNDILMARKNKDSRLTTFLSTLYAESEKVGKDSGNRLSTDEEVIKTIKKFVKGCEETLKVSTENSQAKFELQILNEYLPKSASKEELEFFIKEKVQEGIKTFPLLIKATKEKFGTSFDGGLTSGIIKEQLNGL